MEGEAVDFLPWRGEVVRDWDWIRRNAVQGRQRWEGLPDAEVERVDREEEVRGRQLKQQAN